MPFPFVFKKYHLHHLFQQKEKKKRKREKKINQIKIFQRQEFIF